MNNPRRKENRGESAATMSRPGNPVAAELERRSEESASVDDAAPSGYTDNIPLGTLRQPANQTVASSSRAGDASQASPGSAFIARPKSASSQASFHSAISRAGSPEELSALQAQQKVAEASGEWPLKNA